MIKIQKGVEIRGMVSAIPDNMIDNAIAYADFFSEKEIKKQLRVTGIKSRPVVKNGQRAADLCIAAGKKLLEGMRLEGKDIEFAIFISSYPSYKDKTTVSVIQEKLGIGAECISFDINLACSGFLVGMQTMAGMLQNQPKGTKGMLFVADVTSEAIDKEDRATSMLFGDCGMACIMENTGENEVAFLQKSDGRGYRDIFCQEDGTHFEMDGMAVFNFAITDVVDTIREFFAEGYVKKDEIDLFLIHQAQKFIVDKVQNFSDFPKEKCPISYDRYGNTGCASIPLTLCANEEYQKKRNKVFMVAFGAGHSWSCLVTDLSEDVYYNQVQTNEVFDEKGRRTV